MNTGRLLVLAAAFFWSINGFFVKSPTFENWPSDSRGLALAFWRAIFAVACLLPLVRRVQWDVRMIPMALSFWLMNCTFLPSMTYTTAANAIWLQNTAPLWVFLSGLWLYHEPFDRRNLIPLVSGLAGAAVIMVCESIYVVSPSALLGVGLGTLSGAFYAVVVVSLRRLHAFDAAWLIVINQSTSALLLSPYVLTHCPLPEGNQWGMLIAFGVLQLAIPYWLFAQGLKRIPSQEAAAIGLLEPLLVPLWVALAWGELPAVWTFAGGGLILLGLGFRYLRSTPPRAIECDNGPAGLSDR